MIGPHVPSPIGHAVAGLATAWTADLFPGDRAWRFAPPGTSRFKRAGGALTLFSAALAAAPDLDLLFNRHRTVTHSVGAVLVVALLAAVFAATASLPIGRVTLMCASAYATHLLLDWLGADSTPPYGIQALWPISKAWYISNLDLFPETVRRLPFAPSTLRQNALTVAQELAILSPFTLGVWLVRVKTSARLSTQLPSGNHSAK